MLKILLFLILALTLYFMVKIVRIGRAMADRRNFMTDYVDLSEHRNKSRFLFWLLMASVLVIEYLVRYKGGVVRTDLLFQVHILFSGSYFVVLFLLVWFFTGIKSRTLHKYLAYSCALLFLGVFATAIPIVLRL